MELIRIDSIKPLSLTMADYVFSLLIGGLFGYPGQVRGLNERTKS